MSRPFLALLLVFVCVAGASAQRATHFDISAVADSGLKASVAIDIVRHGGGIWMATGKGVQATNDNGLTWQMFNQGAGLPADNVSALCPLGNRLWVATNHTARISGGLATISDGLSYSDDNGGTWTQVDFGSTGLNIPYVWGGDRTIYDITGARDTDTYRESNINYAWFSAFAGGLLASRDGGTNWRRIYASATDSIQFNSVDSAPSLRNRIFSCVADTSHGDSTFLWVGTAGGVFQYVYIQPREKLFSPKINRVTFCTSCGAVTKALVAGSRGVSIGRVTGAPFVTRFVRDGLPGGVLDSWVSAITEFGGRVFVGTASDSGTSTGLATSVDGGNSFVFSAQPAVSGSGNVISDFAATHGRLYLAAQNAGLFVSADTGANWTHLWIDSVDHARATNVVNALDIWTDTVGGHEILRVGTDSGLVQFAMDSTGSFADRTHVDFAETDSSSRRIIRVRTQPFINDSTAALDSAAIWTCNIPATAGGQPCIARANVNSPDQLSSYRYQVRSVTYDLNFLGDTAVVVGRNGARLTAIGRNPSLTFNIVDTVVHDTLDHDTLTALEVRGDTLVIGAKNGIAFSVDRGKTFRITRANQDTLSSDIVVNHTVLTSVNLDRYGLTGDFVPSMGVQHRHDGRPDNVWFSGRPVSYGVPGIAKTRYNSTGRLTLIAMNQTDYAWNFEFVGDSVFAATDVGLLLHRCDTTAWPDSAGVIGLDRDTAMTWDTIKLVDPESGDALVAPGTSVYSVRVDSLKHYLWVGTGDGTVRIDLSNGTGQKLLLPVDSATSKDEVYAFPVPFFPQEGDAVDFHFVVDQPGNVTVEIYDFAMNLVARPINNVYYAAGIYPNGSSQGRTWDGHNGRGDVVAVGIYYIKVILPNATRWGKLAVLP